MSKWEMGLFAFFLIWEAGLGKTKFGSTIGLVVNPVLRAYRRVKLGILGGNHGKNGSEGIN